MVLSREEVEHIAELAKLSLTDEEKARYQEQLSAILDHFAYLQNIDTEGIPPTASVLPLDNVFRDDMAGPSLPRDDLLDNAPQAEVGMFQVEAVLE
jgi:aspartyl-tRNA(Asn)/glutamyl-tRNA(Gln) amidotransferase subunit C